jgi:DNA-binding IscR family transcriptional regulator
LWPKLLAARHKLPSRHLETLLQGLVHAKILKGVVRRPRGGYELARERRRITVGEIVCTAMSLSTADPEDLGANSVLLERVIDPAVRRAGETFLANLDAITVEQMCETAEKTHVLDDEKVSCTGVVAAACTQGKRAQHGKPHSVVRSGMTGPTGRP